MTAPDLDDPARAAVRAIGHVLLTLWPRTPAAALAEWQASFTPTAASSTLPAAKQRRRGGRC